MFLPTGQGAHEIKRKSLFATKACIVEPHRHKWTKQQADKDRHHGVLCFKEKNGV
jgi:hypothetical protein